MYFLIYYKFNDSYVVANTSTRACISSRSVAKSVAAAISAPLISTYDVGSLLGCFLAGGNNLHNFHVLATSETPFSIDTHPELLI